MAGHLKRLRRRRNCDAARVALLLCSVLVTSLVRADVQFNRDIRPILSDKCFACHGPDAQAREADLRLDRRDDAARVLGPAVPAESDLLARIGSTDPDVVMPPPSTHKQVTPREAKLLREWIEQGAEYEPHWAFLPVHAVAPPPLESEWVRSDLDRFVLARLQKADLTPSPLADRATLIRRVTLDLTGLPPTVEEVDAFLNDPSPLERAYETVVDRLLDSPRFGEHLAWHWLDAARYGDSDGYESDPFRNMWPWRDWVIEAFNRNLPYDQFIVEQLAGDLLPRPTLRQQLATGFNRNHRLNNEGGILPEEWLVEYVCDRAETTATVFMGLTWGCARCHDHKFDPVTQRDYYRLFAYFHNVPEIGNGTGASTAVPMLQVSRLTEFEDFERAQAVLRPLEAELEAIKGADEFETRFYNWLQTLDDESRQALPEDFRDKPQSKWTSKERQAAREHFLNQVDPAGHEAYERLAPAKREYDRLARTGARVMVMGELPQPRETHVLIRGAYDQPGEPVSMGTPEWLPPMDDALPNNRLGLAQWLVSPEHPLTSRVAVNRFWQLLFGTGLVKTPEDLGLQGDPPSHPELLDWLARRFIDSGWDVKGLLKEIVMSSTYRQSSAVTEEHLTVDPENRLLARAPRFRYPAQVIRDQALAASGLLIEKFGGPPVKPYQPDGLWQEIIKGRPVYTRDKGDGLYRRSLYTLWRRGVKPPEMVLLDANERDTCQVNQRRTNTPLQALLLLNDVA
ncbi:MAG: PSD1 domain-containing protein, partial [Planctomycetaceae bacterium]|nr:PSD1 domain-containing protein [Planctomycetaceae bacterium]